jgi:hypothetical protein
MEVRTDMRHLTRAELEAGLERIRAAPADEGALDLIVRRPAIGARELLEAGELDPVHGLVGDTWRTRGSNRTADGTSHPDMQVNIMGSRVAALVAQTRDRWALAGDQLFIDMDLSERNLPPGTRLSLGSAILEITREPHTGCAKFLARFGADAMKFVNSPIGRALHLRGLNARVVQAGAIRVGDLVRRQGPAPEETPFELRA